MAHGLQTRRFANRWGADRLLWVGSVGIVPVSALWFVAQDVWFLACLQILSGLVWGCYELAMLLQFFGQIPGERRVAVLTLYNLGNSAAMVAGTLIGALILNSLGRSHDAYLAVFAASGCLRLVALLALPGRRTAVRATRGALKGWMSRVQSDRDGVPIQHAARIVVAAKEDSAVTSRIVEGGSGGSRRRDGLPATRLPARTDSSLGDLSPRE